MNELEIVERLRQLAAAWRLIGDEQDRVMIEEGAPYRACANDLDKLTEEVTHGDNQGSPHSGHDAAT